MKQTITYLLILFSFTAFSQGDFQIGLGIGTDIGLKSDYSQSYVLKRNSSSSIGTHFFARYNITKKIQVYPIVSITLINFNFAMENTLGYDNPEGRILSVENTGSIPTEEYEVVYLSQESKGRTSHFTFGGIFSYYYCIFKLPLLNQYRLS